MLLIRERPRRDKERDDHRPLSLTQMPPRPPRSANSISAAVPRLLEECREERAWLSAGLHFRGKAHAWWELGVSHSGEEMVNAGDPRQKGFRERAGD